MLDVRDLSVSYGPVEAVRGISLSVAEGQIVCLIGANGAGKSSCLKGMMGLAQATGSVRLDNRDLQFLRTDRRVESGMALVPEGRHVFPDMTVLENLKLGIGPNQRKSTDLPDTVFARFPILDERKEQKAGTLSGGEQQMLAIGRALMSSPRILLLDEPTLGLAPIMVSRVAETLKSLCAEGMGLLLAEQNLHMALAVADQGYVLETGVVTLSGATSELKSDERVRSAYLGA